MGKLINGRWVSSEEQTRIGDRGEFVRGVTSFRDWIRRDGSTPYAPEPGRYHLLVAHNCPWAHRTIIVRNLKGLGGVIGMSVAHFRRNEDGWWFPEGAFDWSSLLRGYARFSSPSATASLAAAASPPLRSPLRKRSDDIQPTEGKLPLHVFYSRASGEYTGSATVPVLWDRKLQTIVSNESAEIIQMLDSEFSELGARDIDLYPDALKDEIDEVNEWVYSKVNNGVYKCGFARTQEAYDAAFVPLFEALDEVEARLGRHRYLVGNQLTLADVRLFTTLARFDAVYHGHFKCNLRRIVDYPNTWGYVRDLYQTPGIGETVEIEIYKKGYYGRSPGINPRGIVPLGPALDFDAPHDRSIRFG